MYSNHSKNSLAKKNLPRIWRQKWSKSHYSQKSVRVKCGERETEVLTGSSLSPLFPALGQLFFPTADPTEKQWAQALHWTPDCGHKETAMQSSQLSIHFSASTTAWSYSSCRIWLARRFLWKLWLVCLPPSVFQKDLVTFTKLPTLSSLTFTSPASPTIVKCLLTILHSLFCFSIEPNWYSWY